MPVVENDGQVIGMIREADVMITRRINRVPVHRDEKLVGIVGRADLVRALAERNVR